MRLLLIVFAFLFTAIGIEAQYNGSIYDSDENYSTEYQYEDAFGNAYKSSSNLYDDDDNDGYSNYYDRHDQNPNVGYDETPTYSDPSYYNNYESSSYDFESERTIYTGPRGGEYYINSNGNKTYIQDDDPF